MVKSKDINDRAGVTAYIEKLDPEFAELINSIRKIILATDENIGEQIKWNSPSFFYSGTMKAFDPKEYKRDIAVMNLRKGFVMLVFPTGARVKDKSGLLEGNYTDGRRLAQFKNMADVKSKKNSLQMVIKEWLKSVDK